MTSIIPHDTVDTATWLSTTCTKALCDLVEQKKLCDLMEQQHKIQILEMGQKHKVEMNEMNETFKKGLALKRGCDGRIDTRGDKRVRNEKNGPVHAIPWFCEVCDLRQSTDATLETDQSELATPRKSKPKDKTADHVKAKRNARKLVAKINAEKDGSGSDQDDPPGYTTDSLNSLLCEARTQLAAEVQVVAVKSKGGRPIGPRPPLYIGSEMEWRSLTREQRKALSKKFKRCKGAA